MYHHGAAVIQDIYGSLDEMKPLQLVGHIDAFNSLQQSDDTMCVN